MRGAKIGLTGLTYTDEKQDHQKGRGPSMNTQITGKGAAQE